MAYKQTHFKHTKQSPNNITNLFHPLHTQPAASLPHSTCNTLNSFKATDSGQLCSMSAPAFPHPSYVKSTVKPV